MKFEQGSRTAPVVAGHTKRLALFLLIGAIHGCTSEATQPSSSAGSQLGDAASMCDRYCAKLTTVTCDRTITVDECTSDCEVERGWTAGCESEYDAWRDCNTANGTAQCQLYNGTAAVVAPPEACTAEIAAFNACNAPDAGH